jgi:hypothetical protein
MVSLLKALSFLGVFIMLSPCAQGGEAYRSVQTDAAEGVIVPEQKGAEFGLLHARNQPPSEYWTPTEQDVLKLEENLAAYLKKAAPERAPNLWTKLPDYKRQYVGIVVGGRKRIYANFVCNSAVAEHFADWKSRPAQMLDGGACYFQVDYDVGSGELSDLQVNGEA